MMKKLLMMIALTVTAGYTAHASDIQTDAQIDSQENMMDELNPFDPNIEEQLREYDRLYEEETGESAFSQLFTFQPKSTCRRIDCGVFAHIYKSQQRMYLYVDGAHVGTYATSTGVGGHRTPNFDRRPNGRIYDKYTSRRYPGGDYNGLGNMPYAVFIEGGFAIHGTAKSNWAKLGQPASHGCVRIHPDNAFKFNRLVRSYGINNTWITIQQ